MLASLDQDCSILPLCPEPRGSVAGHVLFVVVSTLASTEPTCLARCGAGASVLDLPEPPARSSHLEALGRRLQVTSQVRKLFCVLPKPGLRRGLLAHLSSFTAQFCGFLLPSTSGPSCGPKSATSGGISLVRKFLLDLQCHFPKPLPVLSWKPWL